MNLTDVLTLTVPELIERAIASEGDELWLLTGAICGRIDDFANNEFVRQLWNAGHADPYDEEAARGVLRELRDAVEKAS